jgi:ubiquinone/menaquinone biosynthesis C-methylase UbiE
MKADTTGLGLSDNERVTALVYGDTFALYSREEFEMFLAPLRERLRANAIGEEVFRGARCLDAGCGGGRGSVLMAEAGAHEVVGLDISERNVASSRRRAEERGFVSCSFRQASLLDIPFESRSFDVVWCNGVLHHSDDPDRALREIARVLRPGGRMWLYLYGSGGVYWRMVDAVRGLVRDVSPGEAIQQLRGMDVPVRRTAEWIDDWFAPHLRRYTAADVTARLDELGFEDTHPLARGTVYDTSERRARGAREQALMGEGDVRVFARKVSEPTGDAHPLPDPPDGLGSPYEDASEARVVDAPLAGIAQTVEDIVTLGEGAYDAGLRLLVAASIHSATRALLETDRPYDVDALLAHLGHVAARLEDLRSGRVLVLKGVGAAADGTVRLG